MLINASDDESVALALFSRMTAGVIKQGAERMIAASRAHRLAEIRRRQHVTQVDIAKTMGITQARVSRIERGELQRSEVETLAAYVRALGGKLKIVADFGDDQYVLG